jgi:hypothetical protein
MRDGYPADIFHSGKSSTLSEKKQRFTRRIFCQLEAMAIQKRIL